MNTASPKTSPRRRQLHTSHSDVDRTRSQLKDVMVDILDDHEGGEGSEAMRATRAKLPGPLSRVNAYWGYTLFSFQGRPFPAVPLIIYLIYTAAVVSFGLYYMTDNGEVAELKAMKPELKDINQLLGLAVFLVLAFRNNSAYARWQVSMNLLKLYEGDIKYYDLCSNVSNAVRNVAIASPPEQAVELLWWLFAALFAAKQQLRASHKEADFSLLERAMPAAQWAELDGRRDKFQWAIFRYSQVASTIDVAGKTAAKACEGAFLAANSITAAYDSCWRILNTPMPFAYLAHLRAFLCLWLALIPWVFMPSYGWYTMLLCAFICYGILGVEEAAVEVEQPFGHDHNDLPLDYIAKETFQTIFDFILHAGFNEHGASLIADKAENNC